MLSPNKLLRRISPDAQAYLAPYAITQQLTEGNEIYPLGAPFTHACFPGSAIVSLMTDMENDGATAEKVSIGREGFLGLALVLGGERALSRSVLRVPGSVTLIPMTVLSDAVERFACLRVVTRRYAQTLVVQLMETVAGARLENSNIQVAHWLALAFDRVDGGSLELKQDALAETLGIGRLSASNAFQSLRKQKLVQYSRGRITLLDIDGLRAIAGPRYARIRNAYAWQDASEDNEVLSRGL
ncbi:MAG: Crp/Fnr family transcriptional regulator [Salinarimonas sp.]|nr:Crp/Fnr family transcriptional regulator [Salinarimonas sp.]